MTIQKWKSVQVRYIKQKWWAWLKASVIPAIPRSPQLPEGGCAYLCQKEGAAHPAARGPQWRLGTAHREKQQDLDYRLATVKSWLRRSKYKSTDINNIQNISFGSYQWSSVTLNTRNLGKRGTRWPWPARQSNFQRANYTFLTLHCPTKCKGRESLGYDTHTYTYTHTNTRTRASLGCATKQCKSAHRNVCGLADALPVFGLQLGAQKLQHSLHSAATGQGVHAHGPGMWCTCKSPSVLG